MQVRPATPEDAPAIAQVQVASWKVGYRGILRDAVLDALSADERTTRWDGYLTDPANEIRTLVAEDEQGVVGFVSLLGVARDEDVPPGTAEIPALYVHPARWRRGAGSALMEVAFAALVAAGAHEVSLWVLEDNKRAREFYSVAGFKPDGTRRVAEQVGEPEIRLTRLLG